MNKKRTFITDRLFLFWKPLIQRVFMAIDFFDKKGLANHAAGGAYGFLLSAAPILMLAAIFLLIAFRSSPQAVSGLIQRDIPFLEIIFDESWMTQNIIRISRFGLPAIFSVISLIWAGSVFARSLQSGLKIIFCGEKSRNPVKENLISFLILLFVIIFAFGLIISSQTAIYVFDRIKFLPKKLFDIFSLFRSRFIPFVLLGLVSYSAYRIIPANLPKRLSALRGAVFCVLPYSLTFLALQFIINKTRYNFLYGTLGDLIFLLVVVYFFFTFFYLGAQYAKVIDSIDVLLFSNLIKIRKEGKDKRKAPWQKLFITPDGPLAKYLRHYKKGDIIIRKGDSNKEVFYLLDGKVAVLVRGSDTKKFFPVLDADVFFGEMEHLLSENRTATVKAVSDITVLALPPGLFDEVLDSESGISRAVSESLTRRLKVANEWEAGKEHE